MSELIRVLGAGEVWFDKENDSGQNQGLRYLGDTPGFAVPVESEQVDTWSSDGPVAEREDLAVTRITRNATITCKQISNENLALFLIATVETVNQTATPVVEEPINGVLQGHAYHLGVSASNPVGVRNIGSVTVTDDDATPTTFVLNEDYELDTDLGRIYIIPGGDITDGTNLLVDYTPVANSRPQVVASDLAEQYGELRYYARNSRGPNRHLIAPRVLLRPNGEAAFKSRENYMELEFQCEFLKKGTLAQAYIDGIPVTS